jgi:hypothetical protein
MLSQFDPQKKCFHSNELPGLSFASDHLPQAEVVDRAQFIMAHLGTHPKVFAMFKNMMHRDGGIKIIFEPHKNLVSTASWYSEKRLIEIMQESKGVDLIDSVVFEGLNANHKQFRVWKDIDFAEMKLSPKTIAQSATAYALQIETAEWETDYQCAEFMSEGFQNHSWPRSDRRKIALDEYLKNAREPDLRAHGYSHFEIYEHDFLVLLEDDLRKRLDAVSKALSPSEKQAEILEHERLGKISDEETQRRMDEIIAEKEKLYPLHRELTKLLEATLQLRTDMEVTASERLKEMHAEIEKQKLLEQNAALKSQITKSFARVQSALSKHRLTKEQEARKFKVVTDFTDFHEKNRNNLTKEQLNQSAFLLRQLEEIQREVLSKGSVCGKLLWTLFGCRKNRSSASASSETSRLEFKSH